MKIETIDEDGKKALVDLLNESIKLEYAIILSYPRLIDHLIYYQHIQDKALFADIEKIGKDSAKHLGWVVDMVPKLGGKPRWKIDVIERDIDVRKLLNQQFHREKVALEMYQKATLLVHRHFQKVNVVDFFGKYLKKNESGRDE